MSKPLPRRIPSDDYDQKDRGEFLHPHEGEAIELIGRSTVGELQATQRFRRASVELNILKGEPDAYGKSLEILDGVFEDMCRRLAQRITAWDWTDDSGRPLVPWNDEWEDLETGKKRPCARLDGSPEPFRALSAPELYYLVDVAQSEAPAERKNGSSGSTTTSSATASVSTTEPSSISGRSRTRPSSA